MCTHVLAGLCACVWRAEIHVGCLLCSTLHFEIGLFIEPGAYWLASLAGELQMSVDIRLSSSGMAGAGPRHLALKS